MIVIASITTSTCSGRKKETKTPTPNERTATPIVLQSSCDFITFSSVSAHRAAKEGRPLALHAGNALCYHHMHASARVCKKQKNTCPRQVLLLILRRIRNAAKEL